MTRKMTRIIVGDFQNIHLLDQSIFLKNQIVCRGIPD